MDDLTKFVKKLVDNYDLAAMGAFLTFLTILVTFWKQAAIPLYDKTLKPIGRFFYSIYESPTRLAQVDEKLDMIISELQPNSGTSLKDQINRLEANITISEAQRRMLLDMSPYGIWTSDLNGDCTWINETFRTKVDAHTDELLGSNWINAIHPTDRRQVLDEWESAIKDGRVFTLFYRVINLKTQTPIQVKGIGIPAKTLNGNIVGYNGTIYWL